MWGFTMANWLSYMTGSQGIGWTSSVLWDSSFAQLSTTVNSFILFWFCSLSDLKRNDAKYWDWLVWKILVEWSGVVDLSFSFGWRLCSSFLCFFPFSSSFLVWFRNLKKKILIVLQTIKCQFDHDEQSINILYVNRNTKWLIIWIILQNEMIVSSTVCFLIL